MRRKGVEGHEGLVYGDGKRGEPRGRVVPAVEGIASPGERRAWFGKISGVGVARNGNAGVGEELKAVR